MYFVHLYNGRFFRDSRIWSQDHHHKGHSTHCHHYPFLMHFQSSQMSRHQSSGYIQQSQLRLETLETHYASCIATIAMYAKIKFSWLSWTIFLCILFVYYVCLIMSRTFQQEIFLNLHKRHTKKKIKTYLHWSGF